MAALPAGLQIVLLIALFAAFAVGGQVLVHRSFPRAAFMEHNEVGSPLLTVAGTLYAVALGFLTVIVWQQYDGTRERIAEETSAVGNAWHVAVGLPPDARRRLRSDMLQYVTAMVDEEWPRMRSGGFSPKGDMLVMDATQAVGTIADSSPAVLNAQRLTLDELTRMHEARMRRLESNENGLSPFEWTLLIIGAAVIITLCWLFGMRNARVHLIMTGGVAIVIATMFSMLLAMQYPFRGQLALDAGPWRGLQHHIEAMDRGMGPGMRM